MIGLSHLSTSVSINNSAAIVALVTLATAFVFGLAVLPRPSRATIAWGSAFGLGMLGTYFWLSGEELHVPVLRALASGLMLCSGPLLWLGVRLYAGRRPLLPVALIGTVVIPAVLATTAATPVYPTAFRTMFLVAAVFSGLVIYELFALRLRNIDIIMPLVVASASLIIVALLSLIGGLFSGIAEDTEQLNLLRDINGIGSMIYSQCAAVTVVLLARRSAPSPVRAGLGGTLEERLERAEEQWDTGWSLLDIRLEDLDDLRAAAGSSEFTRMIEAFPYRLRTALPTTADIVRVDESQYLVLLHGEATVVRERIREVLQAVSSLAGEDASQAVRPWASIGWAAVSDYGFGYEDLCAAAGEGAVRARAAGGDRWEQVRPPAPLTGTMPVTLER